MGWLQGLSNSTIWGVILSRIGEGLLWFCPYLLKTLTLVGTAAMFMVGGGIIVHGDPGSHEVFHWFEQAVHYLPATSVFSGTLALLLNAVSGVVIGGLIFIIINVFKKAVAGQAGA